MWKHPAGQEGSSLVMADLSSSKAVGWLVTVSEPLLVSIVNLCGVCF